MTDMDTPTLIEALRAAGHTDQADRLRDGEMAKQLEAAGHSDLAASLKAKLEGKPPVPSAPAREQSLAERDGAAVMDALTDAGIVEPSEGEQFLAELKAANDQWVSTPGLAE